MCRGTSDRGTEVEAARGKIWKTRPRQQVKRAREGVLPLFSVPEKDGTITIFCSGLS